MLSGIVKNIHGGRELEESLDAFLAREVSTANLPTYLKDERFQSITESMLSGAFFNSPAYSPAKSSASAEAASGKEDEVEEEADAKPSREVPHKVANNYVDLSEMAKDPSSSSPAWRHYRWSRGAIRVALSLQRTTIQSRELALQQLSVLKLIKCRTWQHI